MSTFKKISGVVRATYPDDLYDRRYIVDSESGPFMLMVQPHTKIYRNNGEKGTLAKADQFDGYIIGDKPVVAVHPPLFSPELLIIQTEDMGFVKVDKFNEAYVNTTNDLKLNLHEDVIIETLEGETVLPEGIVNKLIAVFYNRTTFSIPAQTPPEKILVLE